MSDSNALAGMIAALFGMVIVGAIYFLPWLVAHARRHENSTAIFVLNLLLGWSGLGWIVALVWAVAK